MSEEAPIKIPEHELLKADYFQFCNKENKTFIKLRRYCHRLGFSGFVGCSVDLDEAITRLIELEKAAGHEVWCACWRDKLYSCTCKDPLGKEAERAYELSDELENSIRQVDDRLAQPRSIIPSLRELAKAIIREARK